MTGNPGSGGPEPAGGTAREGGPVLYTVGHGARPIEELVGMLKAAGVRRLVDVRTAPGSRKHPQFAREALARELARQGVEYVWRKDMGGWRRPRADSPHVALRSPGFRGYADHMDTEEFGRALDWLIGSSSTVPTAVMCAESLWWRCHRRLLSDALAARGCTVVHLMSGGRREAHRLHPAARVVGHRPVYDRPRPEQGELPPSPPRSSSGARRPSGRHPGARGGGPSPPPAPRSPGG